jgi:hypothetical protein
MSRLLVSIANVALALVASSALSRASAQARPDTLAHDALSHDALSHDTRAHGARATTEYNDVTDSTTHSLSAFALVDTLAAPPDTFAVELSQRWKGRGTVAPVAPVELALGRARAEGLRASRTIAANGRRSPAVVFLLDGTRRIRLEQDEYVSNGGERLTFETARYRISPTELRLIAECQELRVRVGDRELWIDPAWRHVAADMLAAQSPPADTARRPNSR